MPRLPLRLLMVIAACLLGGYAGLGNAVVVKTLPADASLAWQPASPGSKDDASAPVQLAALSPEERERMRSQIREHWEQASPEERPRMREERHERWQQMPPEERQRRREEMHERWQQMSPEQRQNIREAIRQHRGGGGPPGGPGR